MTTTRQGRTTDDATVKAALDLLEQGYGPTAIGEHIGVSRRTVWRWAKAAGVDRGVPEIEGSVTSDARARRDNLSRHADRAEHARKERHRKGLKVLGPDDSTPVDVTPIAGLGPDERAVFEDGARVGQSLVDIGDELGWPRGRSKRLQQALMTYDTLPESDDCYELVALYVSRLKRSKRMVLADLNDGHPGYRAKQAWLAGIEPGGPWDSRVMDSPANERPLSDVDQDELMAVIQAAS